MRCFGWARRRVRIDIDPGQTHDTVDGEAASTAARLARDQVVAIVELTVAR